MPLLDRKRVVVAKIETTYGTDSAPTGAANAIVVSNLDITPMEAELIDRDVLRPYLGSNEQILAARYVKMTFDVEVAGSGAAGTAPKWDPLLRACGFSATTSAGVSVAYKNISSAFESATIWTNYDGVMHKMVGARGNVKFDLTAKQIPKMSYEFWGLFVPVADGTISGVSYTGWILPLAVNDTNTTAATLHGTSVNMSKFGVDSGNQLVYRNIVNSESVLITDSKVVGSMTFEAGLMATKNWFSIAEAVTLGALTVTHGTTAGNIVEFTSSRVQIKPPKYTSEDGITMVEADLAFVPSSAGGDEITITAK